jgi:hypothetical protein
MKRFKPERFTLEQLADLWGISKAQAWRWITAPRSHMVAKVIVKGKRWLYETVVSSADAVVDLAADWNARARGRRTQNLRQFRGATNVSAGSNIGRDAVEATATEPSLRLANGLQTGHRADPVTPGEK